MSDFQPIFAITPGVQSYEWGKQGSDSLTAQLAQVCVEGFEVDDDKTYAEVSRTAREGIILLPHQQRRCLGLR